MHLEQEQAGSPLGPALRALTMMQGELSFTASGAQTQKEAPTDGGGTHGSRTASGCLGVGRAEARALHTVEDWYGLVPVAPWHPHMKREVGTRAVLQWEFSLPEKTLWQGV